MTFAEIVIFVLLIAAVCFVLSPLQKRLEKKLYDFFRARKSRSNRDSESTIDVTDSIKKEKKDE